MGTRTEVTSACGLSCVSLERVARSNNGGYIDWDEGREGYTSTPSKYIPVVPVQKPAKRATGQRHLLTIRGEERLGSLVAAAGTIWAVYVATVDYNNLWRMQIMPPGPVEICALGILAWLHGKWRRSTKVD